MKRTLPPPLAWLNMQDRFSAQCGPRVAIPVCTDTADVVLAASASIAEVWDTTTSGSITVGGHFPQSSDLPMGRNEAIIFEDAWAGITSRDASGKLQVVSMLLVYPSSMAAGGTMPTQPNGAFPFTFPALTGNTLRAGVDVGYLPYALGSENPLAYVRVFATIVNTDGAAPHSYRRTLQFNYRRVTGIDPSIGVAWADPDSEQK
jgi:hypothetical protein